MSWTEAQSYCRDKHTDLVTINDRNEQNDINQLIQRENSSAGRVWIGLKDTWIWSLSDSDFYRENESHKGFVSVQEQKDWTEAQKHCTQYHTDLASVRNATENHQIQNIITSPEQAWIGLYRSWVWSDNSNFTFKPWKSNEPNIGAKNDSICASTGISDEGRWTDELCRELHHFVCYDGE
uniref:C-type lectin domain-containing protein n=1 Tax=Sinocyclocheilus grahami TaxID=75366 RepID=A0A672PYK6_SINGR